MKKILLNLSFSLYPKPKNYFGLLFLPFLFLCLQSFTLFAQSGNSVSCPADIVKNNDPGTCTAQVIFPEVTNNDPNLTVAYSKPSGAPFPLGTTTVVMQLSDQNGSVVSSCNFNITVVDKEAPVISNCPANLAVSNNKDACGAVVSFVPPTVFERCLSQQKTINYTGSPVTFVVPAGVTSINANVKGAAGGRTYYNNSAFSFPGLGGETSATIAVTPGEVLIINVGGVGHDGTAASAGLGGYNGGGNGTSSANENNIIDFSGGGGGGASDIRTAGGSLSHRIIVAGGGGAAGFTKAGGHGGDLIGANGEGGTSAATGGTQTQGGTGGSYDNDFFAGNGALGTGGNGAAGTPGGGGGGGYYGGGGGSFGSGGGGSSYASASVANASYTQGGKEGDGSVTLSYNQPATLVQTAGLPSGFLFPVGETTNTFTATDASGNTSACTFKVIVTDTQRAVLTVPPSQTFNTTASSYTVPSLVATDNCGIAAVTYSVTGATVRSGSGVDASGNFNAGTSIIHFTVTDINGNLQTGSTSVSVPGASSVTANISDVWAVAPWGNPNTIYLGFGPATLTLNATMIDGIAPYTYVWKKVGTNSVIGTSSSLIVSSEGIYTVAVTDKNGQVATASKEIKVEDLRCGNNDDKVSICHIPNDNSGKAKTICVSRASVEKFLGNGNYLGSCRTTTSRQMAMPIEPEVELNEPKAFNIYPNPANSQFTVQLKNNKALKAEVLLISQTGATVQRRTIELKRANQNITLNSASLAPGVYLVKIISEEGIQTAKVVVQH